MLRRLVPADQVWLTHFMAMEDPLLHSLELHAQALYPSPIYESLDWPVLVTTAYRAWERIFRGLPQPMRNLAIRTKQGEPFFPGDPNTGYVLRDLSGSCHTPLYHLSVTPEDLNDLTCLLHRLRFALSSGADLELVDSLQQVAGDMSVTRKNGTPPPARCVEDFERALNVLHLVPDDILLCCIPDLVTAANQGVVMDETQEASCRRFSEHISLAVTGGEPWELLMHRGINS
ncbi:hypothetical protein [Streptomyces sp. NPDC026673]|uniref:hypothetical protein n=1 Tax=Streptomyces sp. NPDC026673 TaxID=3155724 RepID=UPI0033C810DE